VPFRHQRSPTKEKKDTPHATDVKPDGPVEEKADAKAKKADAIAALTANLELAIQRWKEKDAVCDLKDMTHIQGYDFTNADYLKAAARAGFRDHKPSKNGDITAEDFDARLAALIKTIKRRLAESTGLVRVLLMDGIGRFVFWILSELKDAGEDVLRVEFSLMDINKQMNEYHTRALPNCKVLKGNINRYLTEVAPRRNNAVYDVVYLNYSKFSNDLKAPDVEMGPRVDAPTYLKNLGEEMGAAAQIQATVKTLTH
jgi:hypothetical protein